jgi:hypothetical protein
VPIVAFCMILWVRFLLIGGLTEHHCSDRSQGRARTQGRLSVGKKKNPKHDRHSGERLNLSQIE